MVTPRAPVVSLPRMWATRQQWAGGVSVASQRRPAASRWARTAHEPVRRLWEDGAMASLADATPPIALGALDGRYRGAVAPLVDHLSEAALNRQRVHVEIEWLIHLTSTSVVPGVRPLTGEDKVYLRTIVE